MAEFMLLLLMYALVKAIFLPWGNGAVCYDIFSPASASKPPNTTPTPSYTVSSGLPANFTGGQGVPGGTGGGSGGGGVGGGLSPTGGSATGASSPTSSTVQAFSGNINDAFAQGATQTGNYLVFPSGETFLMPGQAASTGPDASTALASPVGTASGNFLGAGGSRV